MRCRPGVDVQARRAAQDLLATGNYDSLAEGIAFPELNALLSEPH